MHDVNNKKLPSVYNSQVGLSSALCIMWSSVVRLVSVCCRLQR